MEKDLDYGYKKTMNNLENAIKDIENFKIIDTENIITFINN